MDEAYNLRIKLSPSEQMIDTCIYYYIFDLYMQNIHNAFENGMVFICIESYTMRIKINKQTNEYDAASKVTLYFVYLFRRFIRTFKI